MNKALKFIKSKYGIASVLFLVYFLFLDDNDVFVLLQKKAKLKENKAKISYNQSELTAIKKELFQINKVEELERIAREEKLFKRDNEDVFVIVHE